MTTLKEHYTIFQPIKIPVYVTAGTVAANVQTLFHVLYIIIAY